MPAVATPPVLPLARDRTLRAGLAAAGCLAVAGALQVTGIERLAPLRAVFLLAAVPSALASLLPDRHVTCVQATSVVALWIVFRSLAGLPGSDLAALLAAPALLAAILVRLPLDSLWARRVVLALATAAGLAAIRSIALAEGGAPIASLPWFLLGVLVQFVLVVGGEVDREETRGFLHLWRSLCLNVLVAAPVPPPSAEPEAGSRPDPARGVVWALLGVGLAALVALFHRHMGPAAIALDRGPSLRLLWDAWVYLAVMLAWIGSQLFLCGGLLRLLGIRVEAPLDQPWRATHFVAYWRRANVWYYRLLYGAYYRHLAPRRGIWIPLAIVAVFWISGALHSVGGGGGTAFWLRWTLDGAITAATLAFLRWRSRRRIRGYLAGGAARSRTRLAPLAAAVSAGVVLALHGFLAHLSRHPEALGEWRRLFIELIGRS